MITGVLKNDYTEDQIMSAKNTVRVITEVNGQQYISEFEGTSFVALTCKDDGDGYQINGEATCSNHTMMRFIIALFKRLSDEDKMLLLCELALKHE